MGSVRQPNGNVADMFDGFGPVSLEELDRRAAFQRRVDNKYVVPRELLADVVDELAAGHEVLEIGGRRSFHYENVYFDTPSLESFRDHVADRTPRIKVRSRLYADSDTSWFELKAKLADGETRKEALDQQLDEHGVLTERGREFLNGCLDRMIGRAAPADFEPTLVTRFERATLVARSGAERVTIDTRVQLVPPGGDGVALADGLCTGGGEERTRRRGDRPAPTRRRR
jgi:VTC domain-containing protein